ncbi:nad-dependent histone deacetylase sir2 [Trichoderma arundinaceum]|uniref:Nad-dependent histone deacetylase sir2 n=1 Tax=Trichoderma arundinaceum TaxID=490622 RepID=A0A395NSH2_TRIAR|nr:nad-dependent histone deacetylase sir2 [Trichoderma arundinaceum]
MDGPSSPLSSPRGSVPSSPSSPLSTLSNTPSLPDTSVSAVDPSRRYPSPMSTTASGAQSPMRLTATISLGQPISDNDSSKSADDEQPPAKRRKVYQPKERKTEYLNYMNKEDKDMTDAEKAQEKRLIAALRKKKKIVVIAGAGISVSAGIPDFRSSSGLFARAKNQHNLKGSGKHLFDASVYRHDSSTQHFHTMVREMDEMSKKASPTAFHRLLASLAQEGRLMRLYSQNIDGLDANLEPLATEIPLPLKAPWPTTIQLHGGLQKMVCSKCGHLEPFNGELFDGPEAPLCETCKADDQVRTAHAGKRSHGIGRLRPRFVLYNEYNPDEEAIGNVSSADLKSRPDCVIVVGTTLKVPGTRRLVKEMCQVARGRRDGLTIWLNTESEPKDALFKDCWDIVVRSPCDKVAHLAALPPWDCDIGNDYLVSAEQDGENKERLKNTKFEIALPFGSSNADHDLGLDAIPTPRPSPKLAAKKQIKIALGREPPQNGKQTKAAKPRPRKTKQPPKPKAPPKNAVTETFKAVKNVSRGKTTKKLGDPIQLTSEPLPLPAPKSEPLKLEVGFSYDTPQSDLSSVPPSTPVAPPNSYKRETISPKSIPHNMHNLIDC